MVRVDGTMVRLRFTLALCAGEPESVTLKVSGVAFTAAVGVPLMRPVDAFNDKPFGKAPAVNCHVKAPVPPVAVRLCEYATPTWPLGRDVVVMTGVAGVMVRVRFAVAVVTGELESVALNVSGVLLMANEGVPLINPVDAFRDKPVGSVPEVNCQVYGVVPPVAVRVCE